MSHIEKNITADEGETLHGLAKRLLREADGNTGQATNALQAMIQRDHTLRLTIATSAVMTIAAQAVEMSMRTNRRDIWRNAGAAPQAKTGVSALAEGIRNSLMDFPIAGGIRLRDATREQVEEQATLYDRVSRDTGHKARWLFRVARVLQPGEVVGDALSEAEILKAHLEAENV